MAGPARWTWALALVLVVWLAPGLAAARPLVVLPPESASFFQTLLPRSELTESLDIEIVQDHALFRFKRDAAVVEIDAREASTCPAPAGPLCLRVVAAQGPGAQALAAAASDALDRAARSTEARSPWVRPSATGSREPAWLYPAQGFILLVLAGVLLAALRWRRVLASRAAATPAMLMLGALALRFAAHPIPADIRDVLGAGLYLQQRRAGWSSYLHLLFSVLPATHETVWNVNRVLGALAVPLLYVAMRQRFARLPATAAAATLAALPLVVRFSASDTPYVPLCTSLLGAVVALSLFARSGSRAALALGLGLLTCAMQLRPDGPWLIVPAALLFACHPVDLRSIARPSVLALGVGFVAVNAPLSWWAFVGHKSATALAPANFGNFVGAGALCGSPWFDLQVSPWPVALLVVAGAFVAVRARRPGVLWLLATVMAFPFAESAIAQYANARYHIPSLYLACGLAGLAVAALVERLARRRGARFAEPVALALAVVIPVVAALPRVDLLTRMWTPQLEFERFRAAVDALGERCTVVTRLYSQDAGFTPFTDPGAVDLVDLDEFLATPRQGCVVYYRAANCYSPDASTTAQGHDDPCRAFEDRVPMTPIAEWTLPSIPYRGERYTRDPIPVGLYRISSNPDPDSPSR